MTPEQQHLALDLAFAHGDTRNISPEEFLRRFGESDGPALARRLVAEAIEQEDPDDLEAALVSRMRAGRSWDRDLAGL